MRRFSFRKAWPVLVLPIVAVPSAWLGPDLYRTALLGSGFTAKTLCSGVFVSGRDAESIRSEELTGPGYELLRFFMSQVKHDRRRVGASLAGLAAQTAIARDGLGCTLVRGASLKALEAQAQGLFQPVSQARQDALWPEGERAELDLLPDGVDIEALQRAIDAAFAEVDAAHPRRTRALVVVHKGRIVAERYAPGFNVRTPLIGWSMSKTGTNALVGVLAQEGKLSPSDKELLPEWRNDGRAEITLDQLLRMTSGLAFNESYDDMVSDVTQMLFVASDKSGFAAAKPLMHAPGTHWSYSSGTTNIIARILRQTFPDEASYLRFPQERLFGPLGMQTAVLEPDAAGIFVSSSFLYASARDWARLGLLYLRDGVWKGERLLPEGWVAYSLTPTKQAPNEQFGAHLWLKLPGSEELGEPPMPEDAFYMLGHDEQIVAIVPSRDLVIVRLGLTRTGGDWDNAKMLAPIVAAFPQVEATHFSAQR